MSFLTPLFLLGGLAIAGPILFHLIRRNTRERFTFSSLMFLRPEPPRVSRKSRLEDILLLLARAGLLALLALAFARPFFKQVVTPDQAKDSSQRVALLIDVSASMQRAGLWDQCLAKAKAIIDETKPTDSLAIYSFGEETRALLRFDQWQQTPEANRISFAHQALGGLQPGWEGTHLGNALLTASELLDQSDSAQAMHIVALTDKQEGSRLDGLQGHEWPTGLQLTIETFEPESIGNAGLHLAAERENDQNASGRLRVRVVNSEDATQEKFQLAWVQPNDANATGITHLYLPAGQSRAITAPPRPLGENWRLALLGDGESFDNQLFLVPEIPKPIRIHYVGSEKADEVEGMRYYLERAFTDTRAQHARVLSHSPKDFTGQLVHPDDHLLIVTEALPENAVSRVRDFCQNGHPLLLVLQDEKLGSTLAALAESGPLAIKEAKVEKYALLAQMDFGHPLLAPFNEPRYSDFTKIHFWKHRKVDEGRLPGSRVLARFDSGDPALIDLPIGQGHLLALTSGWHPADSQLALSSKFVPLLYSMLELGREADQIEATNFVGQLITLPSSEDTLAELKGPGGKIALPEETNLFYAEEPGIYTLSGSSETSFAVNLPPAESKTSILPAERLAGLKLPLGAESAEDAANAEERKQAMLDEELEKRQKWWRWLLAGAISLALFETWLGGRTWRRPAASNEAGEVA